MLPRQLKSIQFDDGLNTRGDRRAQPEQLLDIALNVEFDDIGGLRCRFPFDGIRTTIVGGGSLANCRQLAMSNGELLVFTSTALYAWIPALSEWEYRGDHLAVMTDEQTVFSQSGDQSCCDRAELNGQIIYCWQTTLPQPLIFTLPTIPYAIWIAVVNKTTGEMVQAPTVVATSVVGNGVGQPRLIALQNSVVLLYNSYQVIASVANGKLNAVSITVGPVVISAPVTLVGPVAGFSGFSFDAQQIPGLDQMFIAVANPTGGGSGPRYKIFTLIGGLSFAAYSSSAGTIAGPIAIAISPDANDATVIYSLISTTTMIADTLSVPVYPTLPAFLSGSTSFGTYGTGTTLSNIAAAYRLTQDSGHYRCYAFWSLNEAQNAVFECRSNWINTLGTTGTEAPFVYALGIGARAFAHDSHVYMVGTFAGLSFDANDPSGTHSELQNTYYLYRDDGFLVSKAVWGEGAGFNALGVLSSVIVDSSNPNLFSFMGGIRRLVPVGSNATNPITGVDNYAERAPREIKFTFDDPRARFAVQLGQTLYITGGILLQYDGEQLTEVGFTSYPWLLGTAQGAAGAMAAAGYSYKATDRWNNARGELDRSTTATVGNITIAASHQINVTVPSLYITRKPNVTIEVWRTQGNPAPGVPFFLASSSDPTVISPSNNGYIPNVPTSPSLNQIQDNLTDAQLAVLPANPENGAVLAPIEPPPASIIFTDNQRIFLAGIPGYPNTIYYSKYRQDGQVVAFSDALTFDVPADGGPITAISSFAGSFIVWCATATHVYSGAGFDDTGGGSNYQFSQELSPDLGCIGQSACTFDDTGWLLKTNKGWYLLDRSLTYHYVGAGIYKYDDEAVLETTVLSDRHQVRILTANRMLIYDTLVQQWAESSINDGVDLINWNGTPAYLTPTGVRAEIDTWTGYTGGDYTLTSIDIETSWIKFNDLQGRAIVDFVMLLGEFRSACIVRKRLAKDYEAASPGVWNYTTDQTWTPFPALSGSSMQVRQAPRWKRCEALKARFTLTDPDGHSPLGGPCARLTAITIPFAIEPNAYSAIAAAQKT